MRFAMVSMSIKMAAAIMLTLSLGLATFAQAANQAAPPAAAAKGAKMSQVAEWFGKYNEIRHKAQMSPQEKEHSGRLMTAGIAASVFKGPDADADKAASQALLKKMVDRYTVAMAEMDALKPPAETKNLHLGYRQYFQNARALFSDYLKIQDNLFATDKDGNSILGQLQQRKSALETLDAGNKDLDAKLRAKYSIAAYPY
jgi:hypothetical protein